MEDTISSFAYDIMSFENNILQLRVLILFINNERFVNSIEKKITMNNKQVSTNGQVSTNELLYHIQNFHELQGYKIQYLLNFTIQKSQEELCQLFNNTNTNTNTNTFYKLNTITNIKNFDITQDKNSDNVAFTNMNTLIIVANKNNKYYIKRNNYLAKNNTSKKKQNHKI